MLGHWLKETHKEQALRRLYVLCVDVSVAAKSACTVCYEDCVSSFLFVLTMSRIMNDFSG